MSVRDDLIAARALIDTPEKWVRSGFWERSKGAMSLATALGQACAGDIVPAVRALEQELPERYKTTSSILRPLGVFSDRADTTHEMVMDVFDQAIAAQGDEE